MQLDAGDVAVVTGAAGGIGLALATRFVDAGLRVVMSDVDASMLSTAADHLRGLGGEVLDVPCDVSDEEQVGALAAAAVAQFGSVKVLCNNAGVSSLADPWFGPLNTWKWLMGVNMYGVVHGVRAFLPYLITGGHIVNTASMAGLTPGLDPRYDASKHAVVAITEDLYLQMKLLGLPIGVSCLCPGWVRTGIFEAERNWPKDLGEPPAASPIAAVMGPALTTAVAEGMTPLAVADQVLAAISSDSFWVLTHPDWMEIAEQRWAGIVAGDNPSLPDSLPGLPPYEEIIASVRASLGM
jgi:NAD(P)-dependent dehydrogenase (short-subunit alcohol dehydrogenase family)